MTLPGRLLPLWADSFADLIVRTPSFHRLVFLRAESRVGENMFKSTVISKLHGMFEPVGLMEIAINELHGD